MHFPTQNKTGSALRILFPVRCLNMFNIVQSLFLVLVMIYKINLGSIGNLLYEFLFLY